MSIVRLTEDAINLHKKVWEKIWEESAGGLLAEYVAKYPGAQVSLNVHESTTPVFVTNGRILDAQDKVVGSFKIDKDFNLSIDNFANQS